MLSAEVHWKYDEQGAANSIIPEDLLAQHQFDSMEWLRQDQ